MYFWIKKSIFRSTLPFMRAVTINFVDTPISRFFVVQEVLLRNGHLVMELIPVSDWNRLWLKVNGEIVFKCDIRDLDFGGDGLLDPLCHKALRAVNNAF